MSRQSGRAVSPVVAVILMVAITVILSAVIGTFVLNLGQSLDGGSSQSVGVSTEVSGQNVSVRVITGTADEIRLLINGTLEDSSTNASPGTYLTAPATADSDVTVVAVSNGNEKVISTSNPFEGMSSAGQVDLTEGLVHHWTFDSDDVSGGVAADVAGGNDADNFGATLGVSGVEGQAAEFNASSTEYMKSQSNVTIVNNESRTLSFWTKVSVLDHKQHFANWGHKTNSEAFGFWADSSSTAGSGYANMYFYGHGLNAGYDYDTQEDLDGSWQHWVVTYNGTTVKTYLNGQPTANTSKSIALNTAESPMVIGARQDLAAYLHGKIDEVRVYNRSLSASEVEAIYNNER